MLPVSIASLNNLPPDKRLDRPRVPRAIWIAAGVFAFLSVLSALTSKGFLEADACTHYLSAHFAIKQPHRLLSVWDRPLFMLLYSVPAAYGGVLGARLMSLALALLCGWCGWRIARRLGMQRPELAFIFVLAEPLLFLHSFSEMTELCFAAVIGLAFLAYMDRRWGWMALLLAISPLGRPEGFGFVLLGAIALVAHRRWWWLLVLPSALLIWTMVGWLMWGSPDYGRRAFNFLFWLPRHWPYSGTSMYASGPLLFWKTQSNGERVASFLLRLPVLVSPLIFPFTLLGTVMMLRGGWGKLSTHQGRCELFAVGLPWGILAGHSYLWWRGQMASSGELRYLLVAGPLWGVIGARGWEWAFSTVNFRFSIGKGGMVLAGVAALLPACANFHYHVVPFHQYDDDRLGEAVARWYLADGQMQKQYPRLVASHPSVYLYLDFSPTDRDRTLVGGKSMVKTCPPGVVFVWDAIFSTHNADSQMCVTQEELAKNGWRKVKTLQRGDRRWEVYLSCEPATSGPQ